MNKTRFIIMAVAGVLALFLFDLSLRLALEDEIKIADASVPEGFQPLFNPDQLGQLRSNLSVTLPADASQPQFAVQTNSLGMRMGEVKVEKEPGTFRVAVMGDEIAFGWGLPAEKAFPAQLGMLLNQSPGGKYEVLNFAIPGYTAFHALKQYEVLVHNFQPDVLILAFGLHDSFESRLSDSELYSILETNGVLTGPKGVLGLLNSMSALGQWYVQRKKEHVNELLEQQIAERKQQGIWKENVSPEEIRTCLSAVIQHQRSQGGQAILVNSDVLNYRLTGTLEKIAEENQVSLFDVRALFDGVGEFEERKTHFELNLEPAGINQFDKNPETTYLFRTFYKPATAPSGPVYIAGDHPLLGENVPNAMPMRDDGNEGDEKANDGVWSYQIVLPSPQPVIFSFTTHGEKGSGDDDSQAFERDVKNHQIQYRFIPPDRGGIHWQSPIYQPGRIPFAHLLLSPESPYLNELGQKVVARRLTHLVEKTAEKETQNLAKK